jgi:alpha-mannosidase
MGLNLAERLKRLRVRSGELESWRIIAASPIDGWTFDGAPIAPGAAWPSAEGVVRFAAAAEVPEDWPPDEARLLLDLGGEGLVTLVYDDGGRESAGAVLRSRPKRRRARRSANRCAIRDSPPPSWRGSIATSSGSIFY